MLRITLILGIVLSGLFCHAQKQSGETWAQVQAKGNGTLKVFHLEHSPYTVTNEATSQLEGLCPSILNEFIAYLKQTKGVEIQTQLVGNGNFVNMLESVRISTGGVMGLGDIAINDERKEYLDFTKPFVKGGVHLITSYTIPTLVSKDDIPSAFKGFKAYSIKGSSGEPRIQEIKRKYLPDLEVVYVSLEELPYKVASDPKSFSFVGISIISSSDAKIKSHKAGYRPVKAGFIFPKNSDWTPVYDEFMRSDGGFLGSPKYKQLMVEYLGESSYRVMSTTDK